MLAQRTTSQVRARQVQVARAPWVSQSHCEKCECSQGTCRQSKTNVTLGCDGDAGLTPRATGVFQGRPLLAILQLHQVSDWKTAKFSRAETEEQTLLSWGREVQVDGSCRLRGGEPAREAPSEGQTRAATAGRAPWACLSGWERRAADSPSTVREETIPSDTGQRQRRFTGVEDTEAAKTHVKDTQRHAKGSRSGEAN